MPRKRVGNKRERIIAAAARLFGEKGYHGTTTAEVADLAGVASGTIYIYFSSKEELIVAVYEEFLDVHTKTVREAVAREADPEAQLRVMMRTSLQVLEANPDLARIFLSQLRQSPEMVKLVARRSDRVPMEIVEAFIENAMRSGLCRPVDVPLTAGMILGAWDSVGLAWVASDCSYPLAAQADELAEFILTGICPRDEGREPAP